MLQYYGKMRSFEILKKQTGQGLPSVLVSIAIMGIAMTVFISMLQYQNREVQSLSEKLAVNDLQKTLSAALADGAVCKYMLSQPGITFNANAVPSAPQTQTINGPIYSAVNPGPPATPAAPIVTVGQVASSYSNSVVVQSIQLSVVSGSGNTYVANWIVNFDGTKTVRPLRPVTVSTILTVDKTNPTAATVTNCQNATGPASAPAQTCNPAAGPQAGTALPMPPSHCWPSPYGPVDGSCDCGPPGNWNSNSGGMQCASPGTWICGGTGWMCYAPCTYVPPAYSAPSG